jgi:hypothetical protein
MAGLAAIPATPPSSKRQSNEAPAPIASEAQSATLGALINRSGCFTRPLLILIAWVDGQGAPEMLKKLFLVLLVLACGYVEAKSEDSSQSREAQSKLQMDATQCWAYYEYVKKCVPDDKKVEINDRLRASLERSEILAFALGQSIGMTEDAQLARYKMAGRDGFADEKELLQYFIALRTARRALQKDAGRCQRYNLLLQGTSLWERGEIHRLSMTVRKRGTARGFGPAAHLLFKGEANAVVFNGAGDLHFDHNGCVQVA